jgi:hypothetical protein
MRGSDGARASVGFDEFSAETGTRPVLRLSLPTRAVSKSERAVLAVDHLPAPATTSPSAP